MSAVVFSDGSCEFVSWDGLVTQWASQTEWADGWLAEWREESPGPATGFINQLTKTAASGVVEVLVNLCLRAGAVPDELAWVGAGPLEDLLSHSANGGRVIEEIEIAAAKTPELRAALNHVWVVSAVTPATKARLVALGARPGT